MGQAKLSNKLARELVKFAEGLGFQWDGNITGGGHIKLKHPNGGMIMLSATPGRKQNGMNARKDIERVARHGRTI